MILKTENKGESAGTDFPFMLAKMDSTIRIEVGIAKEAKLDANCIGLGQVAEWQVTKRFAGLPGDLEVERPQR